MNLNLMVLLPEWILLGTFLLTMLLELICSKDCDNRRLNRVVDIVSLCGILVAMDVLIFHFKETQSAFNGFFISDTLSNFFKLLFSLTACFLIPMNRLFLSKESKPGEFFLVFWITLIGLFFLVSANHLLVMFIALEIVTLSFYVMTAYLKHNSISIEAGIKYLILGSLSAAVMIFGISLVYVVIGSVHFSDIHIALSTISGNKLLLLGFLLIFSGIAFKIAAVPFQLWVPDVYQGAPTPVTCFLAVASKSAGFAILIRLLFKVLAAPLGSGHVLFSILAIATMLYGNLGALRQKNIKRLFGYSSIGHAGYLLIGIAAGSISGIESVLFYLCAYAFTNLAVFFVITLVGQMMNSDEITAYSGLSKRSPFLAASLFIALLSLAGVPGTAGFFAKFYILWNAVNAKIYWLALNGLIIVVVSLFYYLSVIRTIYIEEPSNDSIFEIALSSKLILGALIFAILFVGFYPQPLLRLTVEAAKALTF